MQPDWFCLCLIHADREVNSAVKLKEPEQGDDNDISSFVPYFLEQEVITAQRSICYDKNICPLERWCVLAVVQGKNVIFCIFHSDPS